MAALPRGLTVFSYLRWPPCSGVPESVIHHRGLLSPYQVLGSVLSLRAISCEQDQQACCPGICVLVSRGGQCLTDRLSGVLSLRAVVRGAVRVQVQLPRGRGPERDACAKTEGDEGLVWWHLEEGDSYAKALRPARGPVQPRGAFLAGQERVKERSGRVGGFEESLR